MVPKFIDTPLTDIIPELINAPSLISHHSDKTNKENAKSDNSPFISPFL